MRTRRLRGWRRVFNAVNIGAFIMVVAIVLPLYWLLVSSVHPAANLGNLPPAFGPMPFTISNFTDAFGNYTFGRYLINSVVVAIVSTAVVLGFGVFAAYALARLPIRGKLPIMVALLMISVFPVIAMSVPLYIMERDLGTLNSYEGLIIPYVAINLPFAIWMLRNYLLGIPKEMEESALVDGASTTRTLLSIILPAARPGLFTAGVFTFTAVWTEFQLAFFINDADTMRTIPVGIATFGSQFTVPFGTIFAASVVAIVPIAILVLVFRRFVVSGLTSGAVKG